MNPRQHPMAGRDCAGHLPVALEVVTAILDRHFSRCAVPALAPLFQGVEALFLGRYAGYHGCDTAFHDLSHTLRATVCAAQILDGHLRSGSDPEVGPADFRNAVAAALLHDSGYLREVGDDEGTGAKYTFVHVDRSVDFAGRFLPAFGVAADEIRVIQQAIRCTGYDVDVSAIGFQDRRERYLGCAVGTGDMLSQMAAPDYPARLADLLGEIVEAREHITGDGHLFAYRNARDLMRGTRGFYEKSVTQMLNEEWEGVYRELSLCFDDGRNPYLDAIAFNLEEIDRIVGGQSP